MSVLVFLPRRRPQHAPVVINGRKFYYGKPGLWQPIPRDERGGFVMDLRDRCDA